MKNTYFSVKPGAKSSEFYGGGNSQGLSDQGTKYQGTKYQGTRDEGLSDQVPSDQVPSTNYRTTSVECPGNHPVITLLSPRNHPLLGSGGQVVTDRRGVLADRRGVLADRRGVLADRRDVVAMMRQKCMMWKYVAMLLAVLVLSVGNIGMAWGAEYALLTHSPSLGFTGEFVCNPADPTVDSQTFGGKTFAGYIRTTGNLATWANGKAELKTIDYDIKTTSTTFTIYVGNTVKSTPQLYYVVYDESSEAHSGPDVVQTAIGDALPYDASNTSYSKRSVTIERSKNARVCFYTSASSKTNIYQIIANETGDPLPKVGEGGYALNMVSGRFCATNTTNIAKVDHNLTIDMYNSYNMGAGSNVTLSPGSEGTAGDHYLSFTTPANPGKLKVTFSGKGTLVYSTKKDGTSTTTMTTGSEYTLSGNTLYYLYNTVPAQKIQITKLEFICVAPTGLAASSLTSSGATLTVTDAANNDKYEFYISESSTAPTAGSTATYSVTDSKTIVIDDLDESTTYYAWVRSCNKNSANGKSSWTALTGSTFTTEADVSSCTVTYNDNGKDGGGAAPTDANSPYASGSNVTVLGNTNSMTKTGYSFGGWNTAANGSGTSYAVGGTISSIAANTTLYAKWTQAITLDREGASTGSTSVTATYNCATLPSITNPTKEGYVFKGWYTGDDGTGTLVIDKDGQLQANVSGYTGAGGIWTSSSARTLYAKWEEQFALPATLDKSNVTAVSDDTYWSDDNTYYDYGSTDATNTSRYQDWEVNVIPCTYEVSVVMNTSGKGDGTQWGLQLLDAEENVIASYNSVQAFGETSKTYEVKWNLSSISEGTYTLRVKNIFEWAQPKLKSLTLDASIYTITYDANGGTCGTESVTVCGGSSVTLPTPTHESYDFDAWYTSAGVKVNDAGKDYTPTGNITLYAHWEGACDDVAEPTAFANSSVTMTTATFSITDEADATSYDLYYASGSPSTPTSGTTATENVTTKTPTITGLTASTEYKIWVRSVCDASHKSDWVALGTTSFTTADPETYTITYNKDGATEDQISDGEKTEGVNFILSSTRYTKAGYWHVGWATSQGGSKVYDFGGTYSTDADLALYPAWVKIAVYNPDMSTEAKLTATIDAEFGGVDRWTLTTDANLVSTPKAVSPTAEENLTGEKYGLAFTPSWGSSAKYDLGAQTTLYQLTLDIVMEGNGSLTAELLNGSSGVVKTITNDIPISDFTAWEKKTFTYTYDAGLANVQYIRIYGNGSYVVGLTRIKAEYAPTKTEIVLDNQSATTAGTESVTATYGASTNLTSSITAPSKTGYIFGGYYTEEDGEGTQLIDANGAWLASKTGYTDGSKNWQFANPDLTLYAKWTPKTTTITLDKNNSDEGSTNGSATVTYGSKTLASYTAATRTGYTLDSYKNETSGGSIIIKANGTLNTGKKGDILQDGAWAYDGETLTLYAQWTANKYNVTHTLSGGVSRSSGGQAGEEMATYGTGYSVVFAAESGYALPAAVTVTVGGSDVTANCTWNQGTGTLTIPAADVTGDIVITVTGVLTCTDPTTAFADGTYTIGGSALDLSTLISGKQGDGTITYTVTDANGTGASIAGTSFTATTDGTATVTATQAADGDYCEKVMEATIRVIDPAVTPIIVYNLNVGTSAGTTLKSSVSTTDGTNITNITIDQTNDGASGAGAKSASDTGERTTVLAIKTGANGDDWSGEPTNYELFKFTVGCGKKLTPSKVSMKVANKGGSSANNIKYKAVMSDTYGHSWSGTYIVTTKDGQLEAFQFTNTDPDVYFQGNVTLKLWAWTIATKDDGGEGFRMGTPVQIFGVIADQATPTATIRWTKQPAGGLSGTNETVTAVSSDGSAVTITSNNGSVATVAGSTVSYVGVGSTYLTASGTDACGNTMVSVNSDNFTVIGAYNLSYNANTGTGTMTGETGVHYAVVKANGFTAPSGKVFYGWNTAADGSGDSYQPGDAIELNANTTLYAQWGTALTATWSVTKVDNKLYRGGGGYSVTVYLDDADWDVSGNKNDLELTATEGVTLKNIVKSINDDDKAQVTADFDITTGVDADATSITFTLFVPAAGTYASAELENDVDLTSCAERSVTVTWTPTSDDITTLTSKDNGVLTIGTGSNVFKIYAIRGNSGSGSDATMVYSAKNGLEFSDNSYYKSGIEAYVPTSSNDISDISFYVKTSNSGRNTLYGTHDTSIQSSNPSTTLTLTTDFAAYSTKSSTLWNSCSKNKYYGVGGRSGGSGTVYLQKVTVTFSSGEGGVTPTLSWETDLSGGVNKETGDADFTFTASTTSNTLGAITYSSNNTAVATVNATTGRVHIVGAGGTATITATLAASGCFEEATATYTINVVDNCKDEPGTITSRDLECEGTELTVAGYTSTGSETFQWYKDGVLQGGYTTAKCTVTVAGEYYVVVDNTAAGSGHCAMASTNTVTVTAKAAATATKIVDSWYVKNGRRTPDVALVQSENAESFTVKSGSTTIWESAGSTKTGFGGCGFHMDENGIIYLNGTTDDGSATTGLTAGDETLTITVNGCGGNASQKITIHKQAATDRPSVAFVVDGTKDGEFDADNESHSVNTALYEYLNYNAETNPTGAFDLTAQNIYATTDEKAIREHYSQFDAILITDDPGTKETPSGDYKTKGYVNAFGTMVDVRPILTMEAYVSALANWKTKGIAGEPTSPDPRQYALRLECKDHEIYKAGLPNPAPGTHVWDEVIDGQTYRNVILVDSTKSPYVGVAYNAQTAGNQLPALQGFNGSASGNLLGLGRISDGTLQAAIERQKEPAARLLVFSIQSKALPNALTEEGKTVIKNILTYLLKTNMEEVDDCSNYFTGATNSDWGTASNWSKTELPSSEAKVRILAPCVIGEGTTASVAQVEIVSSGKSSIRNTGTGSADCDGELTINAGGSLIVGGKIRKAEAPYFGEDDLMPMDDPERLVINTSNTAQAALIFNNDDADTKATVNLYSLGRKESGAYQFQYMAVPMEHVSVNPTFADETHPGTKIYTYVWQENGGWERRGYYTDLYAFEGVGITTNSTAGHMDYTMTGNLASTATQEITLTKDGDGENIIGNSWMAPINIAALKTGLVADDNIVDKTVYIYMTGNDAADGIDGAQHSATATAGQWLAIPIDASGWSGWEGLKVIPAMQAYYIKANAETTLTLDYDNLVRSTATESLNEKLRAPRRTEVRQNDISGMRMRVSDSKTHTDLYLFEDGQFSERYDNGWEAKFMEGDGRSAQFYALNGTDKMAVLATDELEGTFLGFVPGKESGYTISFFGGEGRYYLNDLKMQQSTLIEAGNNYPFTYEAGDDANRFLISRQPFGALSPTGCDTTHEDIKSTKIFYNGTLYIIRAGRIYSAEGMLVK